LTLDLLIKFLIKFFKDQFITKKDKFQNDFEIQGIIGEGSYGKVYKVKRKSDDRIFAVKVISK
jgi:serine/threonine protein kinase